MNAYRQKNIIQLYKLGCYDYLPTKTVAGSFMYLSASRRTFSGQVALVITVVRSGLKDHYINWNCTLVTA